MPRPQARSSLAYLVRRCPPPRRLCRTSARGSTRSCPRRRAYCRGSGTREPPHRSRDANGRALCSWGGLVGCEADRARRVPSPRVFARRAFPLLARRGRLVRRRLRARVESRDELSPVPLPLLLRRGEMKPDLVRAGCENCVAAGTEEEVVSSCPVHGSGRPPAARDTRDDDLRAIQRPHESPPASPHSRRSLSLCVPVRAKQTCGRLLFTRDQRVATNL